MNAVESLKLINLLRDNKINSTLKYQEQIKNLLVVGLWSDTPVLRTSLRGRLAETFRTEAQLDSQEKDIVTLFARAIHQLQNDHAAIAEVGEQFYRQLRAEFKQAKLLKELDSAENPFPQAVEGIEQAAAERVRKEIETLKEHALLTRSRWVNALTFENLDKLFQDGITGSKEVLANFYAYLESHKHYTARGFPKRKDAIVEALDRDVHLNQSLSVYRSEEDRKAEIEKAGINAASQVQALSPGKKYIVAGSFGPRILSLSSIITLLKKLPQSQIDSLPEFIKKIMDSPLPNPTDLVDKLLDPLFSHIDEALDNFNVNYPPEVTRLIDLFFYNESKTNLEGVRLPPAIKNELQAIINNGILGCLVNFQDDGAIKSAMEWSCENGLYIKDPQKLKEFIPDIKKKIIQRCQETTQDAQSSYNNICHGLLDGLQSFVHSELFSCTGLDGAIATAPVWIEIEKCSEGTFTVYVYGSGAAINGHEQDRAEGTVKWPIVYDHVSAEKLSTDFFQRFFYHHIEPSYNPAVELTAEELYCLFNSLGTPHGSHPESDWRAMDVSSTKESTLIERMLLKPDVPIEKIHFEYKMDSFIAYCKSFLQEDGSLVFPDLNTRQKVYETADKLFNQHQNALKLFTEGYNKAYTSTLNLIKIYAKPLETSLSSELIAPEIVIRQIQGLFNNLGISYRSLLSGSEALTWTFGGQVTPILDFIGKCLKTNLNVENTEQIAQVPANVPDIVNPRWTQKSILAYIGGTFFKAIYKIMIIAFAVAKLYRSGLTWLTLYFGIGMVADYYVFSHIRNWFSSIINKISQKLMKAVLGYIIKSLVSPTMLQTLRDSNQSILEQLEHIGSVLNQDENIGFDVKVTEGLPITISFGDADGMSGTVSSNTHSVGHIVRKLPISEKFSISESTAVADINKWVSTYRHNQDDDVFYHLIYLNSCIDSLELPLYGKSSFWDNVIDPERCIVALSHLADDLDTEQLKYNDLEDHGSNLVVKNTLQRYKLIAIMQRLASRCLPEFPNYSVSASDLMYHFGACYEGRVIKTINNIETLEELYQICRSLDESIAKLSIYEFSQKLHDPKYIQGMKEESVFDAFIKDRPWAIKQTFVQATRSIAKISDQCSNFFANITKPPKLWFEQIKSIPLHSIASKLIVRAENNWEEKISPSNHSTTIMAFLGHYDLTWGLKLQEPDHVTDLFDATANYDKSKASILKLNFARSLLAQFKLGTIIYTQGSIEEIMYLVNFCKCQCFVQQTLCSITSQTTPVKLEIPPHLLESIARWLKDENGELEKTHPTTWLGLYHIAKQLNIALHEDVKDQFLRIDHAYKTQKSSSKSLTIPPTIEVLNSPEFAYLLQQLEKPEVKELLQSKGILETSPRSMKLACLYWESFFPNPTLNQAYIHYKKAFLSLKKSPSQQEGTQTEHFKGYFEKLLDRVSDGEYECDIHYPMYRYKFIFKEFQPFDRRKINHIFNNYKRSQNAILDNVEHKEGIFTRTSFSQYTKYLSFYYNFIDNEHDSTELQVASSNLDDKLARMISYFRKNKEKLRLISPEFLTNHLALDTYLAQFLYIALFENGHLAKQLRHSPTFAIVLGEFFVECLEYFKDDPMTMLWLVRNGIEVKKYCQKFAPNYANKFPDFLEHLKNAKPFYTETRELQYMYLLHENALLGNAKSYSDQELKQKAINLIKVGFNNLDPYTQKVKEYSTDMDLSNFNSLLALSYKNLSTWLPTLAELLQDPQYRTTLILEVLDFHGTKLDPESYSNWEEVTPFCYQCGGLTVDLLAGKVKESKALDVISEDDFKKMPQLCRILGDQINHLRMVNANHWKTENNEYHVNIKNSDSSNKVSLGVTRILNGRTFSCEPLNDEMISEISKLLNINLQPYQLMWIEKTNDAVKHVYLSNQVDADFHFKIVKSEIVSFFENDCEKQVFTLDKANHSLFSLNRFCDLSKIIGIKKVEEDQLETIQLPYGLEFKVENTEKGLRAVNHTKYTGFYIESNQSHQHLNNFSSYLLLRTEINDKTHRKVLLPSGQYASSAAWRVLNSAGAFVNFLKPFLNTLNQNIENELTKLQKEYAKDVLYEYDMDAKGNLKSKCPKAMAYLVMLYVLQGDHNKALSAAGDLKKLLRRMPYQPEVDVLLLPLMIMPCENDRFRIMRMELFSVIEETRMTHKSTSSPLPSTQNDNQDLSYILDVVKAVSVYNDLSTYLTEIKYRDQLTPSQEYFLFKILFHQSKDIVYSRLISQESDNFIVSKFNKIVKKLGWDRVLELTVLPDYMAERYQQLKKAFFDARTSGKTPVPVNHRPQEEANGILSQVAEGVSEIGAEVVNVLNTRIPVPFTDEKWVNHLGKLFKLIAAKNSFNITDEHINALFEDPIEKNPTFPSLEMLDAASLKKHFIHFYAIANGEKDAELKRKFIERLPYMKGGWDKESRALINLLEIVATCSFPIFPKMKQLTDLKKKIAKYDVEKRLWAKNKANRTWTKVFEDIKKKAYLWNLFKNGVPISAKMLAKLAIPDSILGSIPFLNSALTVTSFIGKSLGLAYWGRNKLLGSSSDEQILVSAVFEPSLDIESMLKDDSQIDNTLSSILNDAFVKEDPLKQNLQQPINGAFDDYVANEQNKAIHNGLQSVVSSTQTYYSQENRVPAISRLRTREDLWTSFLSLEKLTESLKESISKDTKTLLDFVNAQNSGERVITFEDLQVCALKNDYTVLKEQAKLTAANVDLVVSHMVRLCIRETRLQQAERAQAKLTELIEMKSEDNPSKYRKKLAEYVDIMKARREYFKEGKIPNFRLFMRYLMIEQRAGQMVWARQTGCIDKLLPPENNDVVVQLIMGLGKTSTILPIFASYSADGTKAVFNIYPHSVAAQNITALSDKAHAIFHQIVHSMIFSRAIPLTPEELQAISVVFNQSISGDINALTKEYAQAIELIHNDRTYRYHYLSPEEKEEEKPAIQALRSILKTMREGKALTDETHILLDCYDELNYPVGSKQQIEDTYFNVMDRCMRYVVEDESFFEQLRGNNLLRITEKEYDRVILFVANKMWTAPELAVEHLSDDQKKECVSYLTGKIKYLPAWIKNHPKYRQMAMVRGVLNVLLKNVLNEVISVNFGISHQHGDFARPSDGNNNVKIRSCIRVPYETCIKTWITTYSFGLTEDQSLKLFLKLVGKTRAEMKRRQVRMEETSFYKLLSKVVPEEQLPAFIEQKFYTAADKKMIFDGLAKERDAVQRYIHYFVKNQIKFWKKNQRSNSQNFVSQFKYFMSTTGTPYNEGTYPNKCKMLHDPVTIGEALHIIKQKCPPDGIHILKNDSPQNVLKESLEDFFSTGSNFSAIIDGGALLKGLSNESVARSMLENAKTHLPHIKAVKFYRKKDDGLDELVWIDINGKISPVSDLLSPESCLTYYDQAHVYASDIEQKPNAIALVLIGENEDDQTLQIEIQECLRMRGLPKQDTVREPTQKDPESSQSIHFAMTQTAKQKISPTRHPTLEDIVYFGVTNEANRAKKDNYTARLQKIHNVVRRAVLDKIIYEEDIDKGVAIFFEFIDVLIDELETDPAKLYGLIETQVSYTLGLESTRDKVWAFVEKSHRFTDKEKKEIKDKLEEYTKPDSTTMPEKVTAYLEEDKVVHDVLSDHFKETQVYQEAGNLEVEQDQDQDQDLRLEQDQKLQQQVKDFEDKLYEEIKWPKKLNFLSLDWFKATNPAGSNSGFLSGLSRSIMDPFYSEMSILSFPLFQLNELYKYAQDEALKNLAKCIDNRFWATNHFIPRQVKVSQEVVEGGSKKQRQSYQLLLHFTEEKEGTINVQKAGFLSVHDAKAWRTYFENMTAEEQRSPKKAVIYDVDLRAIVAGNSSKLFTLRKTPFVIEAEVIAKFLNGDTEYKHHQLNYLKQWIAKHGVTHMKRAFKKIHEQRGVQAYEGSKINQIFDELSS